MGTAGTGPTPGKMQGKMPGKMPEKGWRPRLAAARDPAGCPGPEVLAGYVERRLEPRAGAAVGAHLARCPRCRFVVGEALFFLRGEERGETR